MEIELQKEPPFAQAQHHFGEVLEFLLNSFRAKLTICSGKRAGKGRKDFSDGSAVVEECPFNFNHFLTMGKALVSTPDMRLKILQDLRILQREGIFDSITPFLIPFTRYASLGRLKPAVKQFDAPFGLVAPTIDLSPVKSIKPRQGSSQRTLTPAEADAQADYPIVIHISDEVKGVHQDFHCQQSVLVQEMGYFSLIISKGQKLHDMDITIHCDVTIFEWLMKWIAHHNKQNMDPPELVAINVVGLTVSADFLKMPLLKSTCLKYLKDNIQNVIADSPNLGCLSDSLLAEFANELNLATLEDIIVPADRFDRITSKLYTQFILELSKPVSNTNLGHYSSTATLFHCKLCDQLIVNEVAPKVMCTCMKFDWQGRLYSCHEKNDNWALGSHVIGLKRELKSWRKVYWRLWATVHFFKCITCHAIFSGTEFKHCRYHPENPRFLVEVVPPESEAGKEKPGGKTPSPNLRDGRMMNNRRDATSPPEPPDKEYMYKPYGKFACCNALTYKYLTSPNLSGCRTKEHTVDTASGASQILHKYLDLIACDVESVELSYMRGASTHNLIQLSIGKSVYPTTLTSSSCVVSATAAAKCQSELRPASPIRLIRQPHLDASDSDDDDSSSDSDGAGPAGCRFPYIGSPVSSSSVRHEPDNWIWNNELSTRYNQDMQRETEEKLMLDLTLFLAQRVPIDSNFDAALSQFSRTRSARSNRFNLIAQKTSGSFVKLEQMWSDENSKSQHNARSGTSGIM